MDVRGVIGEKAMGEELSVFEVYSIAVLFGKSLEGLESNLNIKVYLDTLIEIFQKSKHFREIANECSILSKLIEGKGDRLSEGESRFFIEDISRIRGHVENILKERFYLNEV